jgi:cytochrome c oxidase accessory protein FixG
MKLDAAPWSVQKFLRKGGKQLAWVLIALWTGFTFAGYFTSIHGLGGAVLSWNLGPWETFWILFYALATYGFAGHMREQVCKYMCPYARFQSAMFDKDTLIISYDSERGDPRGSRGRKTDLKAAQLGHCIDCELCVQVCPTGIDIRNGLQYECIGCAACVDVCDGVMDKMGYPRGLVRYDTLNGMRGEAGHGLELRRILRPRVLVYTAVLVVICAGLFAGLVLRAPYRVDVVRDRGTLARIVDDGWVENVYRLQIMNATEAPMTLRIQAAGLPRMATDTKADVALRPAEARWVVMAVRVPPEVAAEAGAGSHPIQFDVSAAPGAPGDNPHRVVEKSTFMVPR